MRPVSNIFTHTSLYSWTYDDTVVEVFPMPEAPFPTTVPWLFFRKEQLAFPTSDLIYSFILTSKESADIWAVFHCMSGPNSWISPPLAPFGGIASSAHCHRDQLTFLLTCVRKWIIRKGGKRLTIKTAPSCYDPLAHELCHHSYLAAGFFPNHTYSNHYIPITDARFEQIIEPAERRRLAKGKKNGLDVSVQTGPCDANTAATLYECYHARGYKLPVKPEKIADIINCTPENYLSLATWYEGQPIAAALMVRVSDTVFYHFLSGFLPEFRSLSPSVMLFEAAYQWGRDNGAQILDLGISLDHLGNEKPALARFKKRIGGVECQKIIYIANL